MNKKSKKLITTLAVFVLMIFVAFWVWRPQAAEAAWFDDNFPYRNAVPVTSHTAAENNVYISTTIDTSTSGQFQADCGDLRFTDYAGNLLPYYISSGCASASTVVHVFFDTMPAGAQNLYYYYGNPSASNGFNSSDFATQAAAYAIGSVGQQEKGGAPVAYWKFDEGTGTSTKDSSPNGSNGTITGATWQTSDVCVSEKCLYLTSTNNISVADPSNGSLDFGTGDFTISTWIRTATSADNRNLIRKGAVAGTSGFRFGLQNGVPNILIGDTSTYQERTLGSTSIADNKWHHYSVVYNRSGNAVGYVDGVQIGTGAISAINLSIDGSTALTIGNSFATFTGFLDDVKIYNYARTAAQIKSDFAARGAQKGSSARLGSKISDLGSLSNGLVGYWKMDEASGNATDSSGNSNTGVATGTTVVTGKFGNGRSTPASNYLAVTSATSLNFTSTTTHAIWIYPTSWPGAGVGRIFGRTDYSLDIGVDSAGSGVCGQGKIAIYTPSLSWACTSYQLSLNTWYHMVFVFDGSYWKLYVNGELAWTSSSTGTINITTNLYFGTTPADYVQNFLGTMDEIRLYNRALSPKEVRDLYNWAPGPVGYWNFEEQNGGDANDVSSNGYTGTATGTTVVSGKYGKARNFNGSSDKFAVSSTITGSQTVEAWIYPTSTTSNILQLTSSAYISASSGTLSATGFTSPTIYVNGIVSSTIVANQWQHIAVTTATAISANAVNLGLANSTYYSGILDDVKIYNYARTAKQIVEDMNGGHPAGGSPVGSQVGYWKFDEGYGTTAFNSGAGSSLNGTITGATWNQNGKFGKALNFDGVNDSVSKSSPSGLPTGSAARTISMWINPTNTNPGGVLLHYGDGPTTGQEFIVMMQTISGTTYLFTDGDNGSNNLTVSGSEIPSSGQWSHFVFTVDGSSNWKYYLNGKYTKGGTFAVAINTVTPTSLDIGVRESSTGYFPGMIDEVKIYNYALTQDEVALDYAHGAAMNFGTLSDTSGLTGGSSASSSATASYCVPGSTDTCSAPGGEWNFEEKTGSTVYDSSGNGLTGTFLATPIWTSGKYGSGLSFNVVGNNRVSVTDSTGSPLDVTTAYTTSAWIKPTAYGTSYHYILDKGTQLYGMYLNNSAKIIPVQNNISRTATTGTIPLNVWTYISITYDGATIKKYINGILDSSQSVVATISTDDTALIIGGTGDGSANMVIDGIRIYNYARTQAQVAWDYNQGKPVGQWKMDECQGGSVFDSSGNGNTGTISIGGTGTQTAVGTCTTSGAWYNGATGKYNSSLNFDSTDDYVDLGDPSVDDVTGAITVSAWVKPASVTGSTFRIFGDENSAWCGYTCGGYSLYISSSGIPVFIFGDNATGGNSGNWDLVSGGSALSTGTWQHIVGVWDGTTGANGMKIYVNGILKGQATAVQTRIDHSTPNTVIGAENDSVGTWRNFFNGQIDDVRVYNYALTATQVKMLYNEGAGTRFGP